MNKAEIVFKIIEIAISIAGLVLVVFGWIVPYQNSLRTERLRSKNEERLEQIRWKKELVEKQISELYGPLYALMIESDISFSRIQYQLGRNYIIPANKSFYDLPENEQRIWKHYVDTYKIASQMEMVKIIRNNQHLIYNHHLPSSYQKFLDYCLGWELLDNQKRNGVENYYECSYIYNYPREFNRYVKTTYEILLKEQEELIKNLNKQLYKL